MDHFTRQCVVLDAGRRQTACDVTEALDRAIAKVGKPDCNTVDNGTEFAANAFDAWAYAHGIQTDFIRPGRPTENAMIESLNGKLRDECLNLHWFASLAEAQHRLNAWKEELGRAGIFLDTKLGDHESPKEVSLCQQRT